MNNVTVWLAIQVKPSKLSHGESMPDGSRLITKIAWFEGLGCRTCKV